MSHISHVERLQLALRNLEVESYSSENIIYEKLKCTKALPETLRSAEKTEAAAAGDPTNNKPNEDRSVERRSLFPGSSDIVANR